MHWAAGLFDNPLFQRDGSGELLLEEGGGRFVRLSVWLSHRVGYRTLHLETPPHAMVQVRVYATQVPVRGASIWSSLLSVHEQLRLEANKLGGRWAAAAWDAWSRYLADICGLEGCLVNKAPANPAEPFARLGNRWLDDDRSADLRM